MEYAIEEMNLNPRNKLLIKDVLMASGNKGEPKLHLTEDQAKKLNIKDYVEVKHG